ncbi:MAG TPA: AAA family ATPase [Gaiellaceae bacterium]|nr:AAA family ATPase [Gaiellaceae bacterium]
MVRLTEAPWFDLVESKLQVPAPRPGSVSRTGLVNRLRATGSFPVLTVTAPAGYGKTTLLAQWAAREARPFAWVSIDERDNDPVVFLRHLVTALDRIDPVDAALLDALRPPRGSVTRAVPKLGAALAERDQPVVIVLDDVHLLRSREATGAVAMLVDHVGAGSIVALAGRAWPRLPLASLRAAGRLVELGAGDLALTPRQAGILLANTGTALPGEHLEELLRRTEGWPAGLYLAALSLQGHELRANGGRPEPLAFAGDDRFVADYFRSECLSGLTTQQLNFLRRTAVLETMCAPLCDAVLERTDSARELASLERSSLFLVPLDRNRRRYRYHHLFRDLLLRELTEREPELVLTLHRRAADWLEANGEPESAIRHTDAAGDPDRVARLVASAALPAYHDGRVSTVETWLDRFDAIGVERYPQVAAIGAWVYALRGRTAQAEQWLDAAERALSPKEPCTAVLRAAMCRDGIESMLRDAEAALAELPASSRWRPTALLLQGCAYVLLGEQERGDASLAVAAEAAGSADATDTHALAVSQRSLLAATRGDAAVAETLAEQAHDLVEQGRLGAYATSVLELAASARARLRHGSGDEARAYLTAAARLTPALTDAVPWLAVQARLELARVHLALRDAEGAGTLVAEADRILRRLPRLGVLGAQAGELRRQVEGIPEVANGNGSGLTGAELRLLPLLATHLCFREIGDRLHVSRNTVKTQAISVYRKLGVSSRSDAIDQAARLGLL